MAAHVRQQIRDAFVAILKDLDPDTLRVMNTRKVAPPKEKLPCVIVSTPEEASERLTMGVVGTRRMGRALTVRIEILVEHGDTTEEVLDDWAARVEAYLNTSAVDAVLRPLVKAWWLGRSAMFFAPEGATYLGGTVLDFIIQYHTLEGTPRTAA